MLKVKRLQQGLEPMEVDESKDLSRECFLFWCTCALTFKKQSDQQDVRSFYHAFEKYGRDLRESISNDVDVSRALGNIVCDLRQFMRDQQETQ